MGRNVIFCVTKNCIFRISVKNYLILYRTNMFPLHLKFFQLDISNEAVVLARYRLKQNFYWLEAGFSV
jgi:hypothetical protein